MNLQLFKEKSLKCIGFLKEHGPGHVFIKIDDWYSLRVSVRKNGIATFEVRSIDHASIEGRRAEKESVILTQEMIAELCDDELTKLKLPFVLMPTCSEQ